MREDAPLRVHDETMEPHVAGRKPLDPRLANRAVALVLAGESELEMAKCAFPRHAVVLYDHEVPVASINVSFECGDVLLWPRWRRPEVDWDKLTGAQEKKALADAEVRWARKERLSVFRDHVGFPIDEKWR